MSFDEPCVNCARLSDELAEARAEIDDIKRVGTLRSKNGLLVEQQKLIRQLQARVKKFQDLLADAQVSHHG